METSVVISIIAAVIAGIGLLLSSRKDTRSDAAENAMVQTKLDNLISGVNDIRVEVRSMRESINDHGERLSRIEAVAANNSHRLDVLEKED